VDRIRIVSLFFFIVLFLTASIKASSLNLTPMPVKIKPQDGRFIISRELGIEIQGPYSPRVLLAKRRFLHRLAGRTGIFFKLNPESTSIKIVYKKNIKLSPIMDESYTLLINQSGIILKANTDIGILRGIETLLQLLSSDGKHYYFPAVEITDYPRFPWRGLLIDVVRHFMPIEVLKRNIDAMAAVKMNVLHLHLSDDQGFRIECKIYPRLHLFASDGDYYTHEQIKDLIRYADLRGIRIVPEFDIPGHTTSWLVAYPSLAAIPRPYKMERTYGVKNPVMDPTNKLVYKFLERFFKEMAKLFPDPYIHIGGDEVNGVQWKSSKKIAKFMKKHHLKDFHQLQAYFNLKVLKILKKNHKKMIGWDEILHPDMPKDIVIQSWRGKKFLYNAAKRGYYTILSNGYYIDLAQPTDFHYLNDPIPEGVELSPEERKRILGGEATMWSEIVSPETIDSRIWPRTAAIAERLWSPGTVKDVSDMYRRLKIITQQMEELGITHIKNQDMMLRRLARYRDITPLKIFIQTVAPVQNYERHKSRTYTVFSPLTRVVDAAVPDPPLPREFESMVADYLSTGDRAIENRIINYLILWKDNHNSLKELIEISPVLKEIEPLSENLSIISALALERISIKERGQTPDPRWIERAKRTLEKAKKPVAELELLVAEPIEKLILSITQ